MMRNASPAALPNHIVRAGRLTPMLVSLPPLPLPRARTRAHVRAMSATKCVTGASHGECVTLLNVAV